MHYYIQSPKNYQVRFFMDYLEPCCCFDSSLYTGTPDAEPCRESIDVPGVIREHSTTPAGNRTPWPCWRAGGTGPGPSATGGES